MKLIDILKNKKGEPLQDRLIIIGVNPIIVEITENPQLLVDLMVVNEALEIKIIYENETENFNQSLFYEKGVSKKRIEFDKLQTFRNRLIGTRGRKRTGLLEDIQNLLPEDKKEKYIKRILLLQNNFRHNVNIIIADDIIWFSFTTLDLPTLDMYIQVTIENNSLLYNQLSDFVSFLLNKDSGGKYLSKINDELIEMYDMNSIPRGIYPREAFYSTDYQRYSIWAFVFNRKGELLLHQRSAKTKDNRLLWDKSAGGHVDITDSSTLITAKRELVEELFLPEAEYTKFMQAELGDIIDFGEWNIEKRPVKHFRSSFDGLDENDWVIFKATDKDDRGDSFPMTIRRKSQRIMHVLVEGNEEVQKWYTRFISDVYLFVAPDGIIDSSEEMNELFSVAEKKGAAKAHKLINIENLIDDVKLNPDMYTDDIVYMCSEKKWLLVQFAESIKYLFQ